MTPKRRTQLLSSAALLAFLGGGLYLYLTRETPNPAAASVTSAAKSGDYASVSKAVQSGQLKPDDVRFAVREEFQNQTLQRVNAYFDTADPKTRQAILDKAIDDLEKFRAESRKHATTTPTTTPTTRLAATKPTIPTLSPQLAMVGWALSQPAATRARLAEFRVAFEKRRSERGLPGLFDNNASLPLGQPTHK